MLSSLLVFVSLLAGSVWVGGFVAIAVVARVAHMQLDRPERIAFFRELGRRYLIVGLASLAASLASGGALLADRAWDGASLAAVLLAAALLLVTAAGVVQARGMTRTRTRALADPADPLLAQRVRRGAARATLLRASIGALTLALVALAAALA